MSEQAQAPIYSGYDGPKIFVFGSNELGIHKRGAAKDAVEKFGARVGQGFGPQGQSFAIPTKSDPFTSLPLEKILDYVDMFIWYALGHQELEFYVTRIGCGLAGYKDADIAPMFRFVQHTGNLELPEAWKEVWGAS
jgi:hypothetical protein